jgi:hypothetical protein
VRLHTRLDLRGNIPTFIHIDAADERGRPRDLKDPLTDAERMEIARLARLAGQVKESGVFFRLQLKPARERQRRRTCAPIRCPNRHQLKRTAG